MKENELYFNKDNCYVDDNGTLIFNKDEIEKLINCFYSSNVSVIIPDEVNNKPISIIGNASFSKLKFFQIQLPKHTKIIRNASFYDCQFLKEITIPNSVTEICPEAFAGCKSLKSVILSNNMHHIRRATFASCSALENIFVPTGITKIEDAAFLLCHNLRSIVLPCTVSVIENYAFQCCSNLEIAYRGTEHKLSQILTPSLENSLITNNCIIFSTYKIDKALKENNKNLMDLLTIPAEYRYAEKQIEEKIKNTTDLNKKLSLISISQEIAKKMNKNSIIVSNDYTL